MNKKQIGVIAMLIAAFGLAFAVLLMKIIPMETNLQPQDVAIWRFTIGAPTLWLILLLKKKPKPASLKSLWRFLALGGIYSAANFSAVFALQRLPSSIYIIIFFIYPSLVILYALLSDGTVPRLFWIGLPLTMVGLFLTSFEFGSVFSVDPVGLLITVANACAVAVYMVLSEKVFRTAGDHLAGTTFVFTGAMLAGFLMIPFLGMRTPESVQGWALLIALSIIGTLIPIFAMNIGLGLLTAARGSIIITIQPVLNILLGVLFLHESLSLQQWIGGGIVILAVILLERSPDRVSRIEAGRNEILPQAEQE